MSILVESSREPATKVTFVRDQAQTLLLEMGSLMMAGYRLTTQSASPVVPASAADAKQATVPVASWEAAGTT